MNITGVRLEHDNLVFTFEDGSEQSIYKYDILPSTYRKGEDIDFQLVESLATMPREIYVSAVIELFKHKILVFNEARRILKNYMYAEYSLADVSKKDLTNE